MVLPLVRVALVISVLSAAGCSRAEPRDAVSSEPATSVSGPAQGPTMTTVEIVSGAGRWIARIDDGPAARDILAQLPLALTLKDYGGNEKIADLPRPVTREGAPEAMTPHAGDIALYAP